MSVPARARVVDVDSSDPAVAHLLDRLTAELASAGYSAEQTFGYTAEQLTARGVHLVGAYQDDRLVGVAGIEAQHEHTAELKRFYVTATHRGTGVATALLDALVDRARTTGTQRLRLETGDKQTAAIAFYRRNGFLDIERFGPYVHSRTSVCMQRDLTMR